MMLQGFCIFIQTKKMYEHKKQALATKSVFYQRLWQNFFVSTFVLLICLLIGITGYKLTVPEFDWYDSLLNASMILSGMGPVIDANIVLTKSAKVFASLYALFSGVAFISTIGILIAPIAHRFFHKLHLEDNASDEE
jgi:ABC-type glycerol-3-phosphate transport system permease component